MMILFEQDRVLISLDLSERKVNLRRIISYNGVIKGRKVRVEELLYLFVIDYSVQRQGGDLR